MYPYHMTFGGAEKYEMFERTDINMYRNIYG